MFDPNAFLSATLTEPTTKREPLPIGDYVAVIEKLEAKSWAKEGREGVYLETFLGLQIPPDLQQSAGLSASFTLKTTIFLDITEQGNLDTSKGKNRALGMYREALDMNKTGDTFSPNAMVGRTILAKLGHKVSDKGIFEEITGVAKLA